MSLKEILKDAQGVPTGEYKKIAGGTMYADSPIGSILPYGGTTVPSGWMICNGASLLRADYAELFAVIGTAFGSADSTHFNIPDLRGEFLRGAGTNGHSGQGSGGNLGEHQDATGLAAPVSASGYSDIYDLATGNKGYKNPDTQVNTGLNGYSRTNHTQSSGGSAFVVSFRPTNTSVNYIIKVMMVSLPTDLDSAVDAKIAAKGSYSTSEVDTGLTWIDGKKIYRKAINLTVAVTDATNVLLVTGVENVINSHLYALRSHQGVTYKNEPYYIAANDYLQMIVFVFDSAIGGQSAGDLTAYCKLGGSYTYTGIRGFVEYTKLNN